MNQTANVYALADTAACFGVAELISGEDEQGGVTLRMEQSGRSVSLIAQVAVPRSAPLLAHCRVLVAGNSTDQLFVIGLLDVVDNDSPVVKTNDGAESVLENKEGEEKLLVYSSDNKLVFEYDSIQKKSILHCTEGDVVLNAENGNIKLNAAKEVEINGSDVSLTSKRLSIKSFFADLVIARMETQTDTIIESAKNVYRTVKELTQLRAGRRRVFVDETYQVNADKVLLRSENDVKVKAEKIHLG